MYMYTGEHKTAVIVVIVVRQCVGEAAGEEGGWIVGNKTKTIKGWMECHENIFIVSRDVYVRDGSIIDHVLKAKKVIFFVVPRLTCQVSFLLVQILRS